MSINKLKNAWISNDATITGNYSLRNEGDTLLSGNVTATNLRVGPNSSEFKITNLAGTGGIYEDTTNFYFCATIPVISSQNFNNIGIGNGALLKITGASNNISLGTASQSNNVNGTNNISIGVGSLGGNITASYSTISNCCIGTYSLINSTTGNYNSVFGDSAGYNISSGGYNSGVGYNSLFGITSGIQNVGVGSRSGYSYDGSYNTFLGANTDCSGAGYSFSTALGAGSKVTANHQIQLGTSAETVNFPGNATFNANLPTSTLTATSSNQMITKGFADGTYTTKAYVDASGGTQLLTSTNTWTGINKFLTKYDSSTTNISNSVYCSNLPYVGVGLGPSANNTFIGQNICMYDNSSNTIQNNTFIGQNIATAATFARYNIAIGNQCLQHLTSGNGNQAYGLNALQNLSIGDVNFAFGNQNMVNFTSGSYNFCMGTVNGANMGAGSYNLLIGGANICYANNIPPNITTCNYNIALGYAALTNVITNTTLANNVAVGCNALNGNGGSGTFYGLQGSLNTACGDSAGYSLTNTSSRNTFLGAKTDVSNVANTYTQSTALGYGAIISGNNQIVVGTSSETTNIAGGLNVTGASSFGSLSFTGTLNSISTTTFNYLSGLTSSIQTQFNNILNGTSYFTAFNYGNIYNPYSVGALASTATSISTPFYGVYLWSASSTSTVNTVIALPATSQQMVGVVIRFRRLAAATTNTLSVTPATGNFVYPMNSITSLTTTSVLISSNATSTFGTNGYSGVLTCINSTAWAISQ